jgi:hypothetical protein
MSLETTQTLMTTATETTEGASSSASTAPAPADAATGDQQPPSAADTPAPENQSETTEAAPETVYEFTMPEGVEIDPATLGNLTELSKELGLTKEQAQKVADLGAQQAQRWAQAQEQAINDVSAQWIDTVKTDKEIGGDRMAEKLAVAKRALDRFGSPELTQLLDESRLGNHPELIRAFYRAGKAISDDALVPGGRSVRGSNDPASRLYDNSNLSQG